MSEPTTDEPGYPGDTEDDRFRLLAVVRGPTLSAKLDREEEVHTWPNLIMIEFLAALTVIVIIWIVALTFNAPLEEMANPALTPNPAKAPWYFVGLQELLHYFDPWVAGVALPTIILVGLAVIPYVDINRAGTGEYAPRKRPFAYTVFVGGFLFWVGLIFVGEFCRGPGWQWYWPWESWDTIKPLTEKTWNLPPEIGIPLSFVYFAAWLALPQLICRDFSRKLGIVRYVIVFLLLAIMVSVPLKIILANVIHLKYLVVTPWFRI